MYKATVEAVSIFSDQNDGWYKALLGDKITTQKTKTLATQALFGLTCTQSFSFLPPSLCLPHKKKVDKTKSSRLIEGLTFQKIALPRLVIVPNYEHRLLTKDVQLILKIKIKPQILKSFNIFSLFFCSCFSLILS